jgi:DHA1 family bicyclomycin/chloramphenicol resistance-like MFS transporter
MSVLLLGSSIVSPLVIAQALSPFGEKAGAASALLGFWQMMTAAAGVCLIAGAKFALGAVLTTFSLAALGQCALEAFPH